jgi:hypothetical protein
VTLTLTLSEPLEWGTGTHWIALRKRDGSVAGPFEASSGATAQEVVLAEEPGFTPYTATAEERTHFAFGPGEAWSMKARVLAVRPRGEQIEIACVGEHEAVHDADAAS